jgi:hypothetical protein
MAASAKPTIRANGLAFSFSAACAVMRTQAAAPSFRVLELAAVTVPRQMETEPCELCEQMK